MVFLKKVDFQSDFSLKFTRKLTVVEIFVNSQSKFQSGKKVEFTVKNRWK